ncbi:MAG TPA: hypothetical protein VLI92_04470 [Candidatus Saccharimonadales bacterium]|nr:hypothetical protein [Candidatus Saccharimonadales bacterium]
MLPRNKYIINGFSTSFSITTAVFSLIFAVGVGIAGFLTPDGSFLYWLAGCYFVATYITAGIIKDAAIRRGWKCIGIIWWALVFTPPIGLIAAILVRFGF